MAIPRGAPEPGASRCLPSVAVDVRRRHFSAPLIRLIQRTHERRNRRLARLSAKAVNGLLSLITAASVLTSAARDFLFAESNPEKPEVGAEQMPQPVIGLLLPETEPQALSLKQGALLGVEDWKGSGGTVPRLIVRGAAGQWGTDGVEAARMVTDDEVQGLIAPTDGAASHLALQIAGRTAAPVVSLCGDSSVTQTGVRWMVRVAPSTMDEASAIFSGLKSPSRGHETHWIALVPFGRAGRETSHDLTAAAANSGVRLDKTIETRWPQAGTWPFDLQGLTNSTADVLVWLEPKTAGSIVKWLRESGFKGRLAGPAWLCCSDFQKAAGTSMEDFIVATPAREQEANTRYDGFARRFQARFGRPPDMTAALSYDAVQLLLQILAQARGRPAHQLFPLDFSIGGVTGMMRFDDKGNRKVVLELRAPQASTRRRNQD